MYEFGGKNRESLWQIETNSIQISDPDVEFRHKCKCINKRTDLAQLTDVCMCSVYIDKPRQLSRSTYIQSSVVLVSKTTEQQTNSHNKRQTFINLRESNTDTNNTYTSSTKSTHYNKKYQLYKTEMCRSHSEVGYCKYGDKCQFAHSEAELRYVQRHPKYKTETCKTFWEEGSCPYGKRCCFIHVPNISLHNPKDVHKGHKRLGKILAHTYNDSSEANSDNSRNTVVCTKINVSETTDKLHCDDSWMPNDILRPAESSSNPSLCAPAQRHDSCNERRFPGYYNYSFDPIVDEGCSRDVMLKRPFWKESSPSIWMDECIEMFYPNCATKKVQNGGILAPGGIVCKALNKKVSQFVLEHLGM
ncbi:CCCH-type Zn-finger protein [Ordospora colligata]|uniref:CCCH-type Zn-finger protein n=1 Tax=Ordospora colligata OC4 TaxID=1354746 RepID=A0A0B2UMC0_9MICR|nr:CCCH-type Zn-finger protein [Ordospora colligata OC4]KHN70419.1 CCCH-type Zn-finger protein [Ordospora colligata OC4]TBU17169.1 CCCH-type Zn-finger protein [Ordospora colligata]TBU17419.1 CCCH-type Zn-finger protein [Ordospora colligata]TBU19599.1 CCCH-type Zn-finger protein [Ordospora colligata]